MTRFYKITKKQQREAELSFVKTGLYYYTFLQRKWWNPVRLFRGDWKPRNQSVYY